jgi:NAD(P)H-dependent flavin oxidoreductase YrpB (nitropropane dioxygenase family)
VAAGGIADAVGARAALAAGADAIAMGTRFVASDESLAHPRYRRRLIEARTTDTVLTELFDGGWEHAAHRVLGHHVYEEWLATGCPHPGQRLGEGELVALAPFGEFRRYAIHPPIVGVEGDVEAMAMYAGEGVEKIDSTEPAGLIVARFASSLA